VISKTECKSVSSVTLDVHCHKKGKWYSYKISVFLKIICLIPHLNRHMLRSVQELWSMPC
jgi:hypothetical protein